MNIPLSAEQQQFVQELCKDSIFTPTLLYTIMSVESQFNINATSKGNDIGIMQIHKTYFDFYVSQNEYRFELFNADPTQHYNFKTNVITGLNALEYIARIYNTTNFREILAHYNGGNTPNYEYADKVLKEWNEI
jgi:soluble lytic murein transglycosylase-like protein